MLMTNIRPAQLSAVVAGITAATANALASNSNMDDILAVARGFSHKDRESSLAMRV